MFAACCPSSQVEYVKIRSLREEASQRDQRKAPDPDFWLPHMNTWLGEDSFKLRINVFILPSELMLKWP